jgi:hypothetical protein
MTEDCCVCFSSNYIQNSRLACEHPLCNYCFYRLEKKICPLCRSDKMIEFVNVKQVRNKLIYVSVNKLIKYTTQSFHYQEYMEKFIKLRRTTTIISKVNRFLPNHKFIFLRNEYVSLGDMNPNELLKFAFGKNSIGLNNTRILMSEFLHRINKPKP